MIVDWPGLRYNANTLEALGPLAEALAAHCPRPLARIHLRGSLGAGKTSLARALLLALGVKGRIKSPSFAVVESYETSFPIHHLDLYRLDDPMAWRSAGLRELFESEGISLVEWPEKAQGLPPPDLDVDITWLDPHRPEGPRILWIRSPHAALLSSLAQRLPESRPLPSGLAPDVAQEDAHPAATGEALDAPQRRSLVLLAGSALLLGLLPTDSQAIAVMAVRVWPADEYTRVAIEHDTEGLSYKTQLLANPSRLVVDLEGMQLSSALRDLVAHITPNDPFIRAVRVGQFQPSVVRLVFDLRQTAKPEVFRLPPIAQYQHRLVIDLFPEVEVDPLLSFLQSIESQRTAGPRGAISPSPPPPSSPSASAPSQSARPDIKRLVTVALDPGHGGEDPGAIGRRGTREKDVVLKIARLLKQEIDAVPGMRAYLTRDDDYFVPLSKRVEKARRVRADLMVSIHADAWVSPTARGSSVFVLSQRGATSAAARWMANKENESDKIGGFQLARHDPRLVETLIDMSTTAQIKDSIKLAQVVLSELGDVNHLHKRQVEQAGFAVLKAPDVPSILVETAFISNPEEEERLRDQDYQRDMAKALARGIRGYLAKYPPQSRSELL